MAGAGLLRGRGLGVALHWATAVLALATLVARTPGQQAAIGGLFAAAGLAFVARAVLAGPLTRPGPRLSPGLAWVHLGLHRGLMVALLAVIGTGLPSGMAGAGAAAALGGGSEALALWHERAWGALLGLAAGHVVFNLWRGAALGERPFAAMLPR